MRGAAVWGLDDTIFVGFGSDNGISTHYDTVWKYEPEVSAIGDPHVTSLWGCTFEADKSKTKTTLISCESEELTIVYNKKWNYHIYQVRIKIRGKVDVYDWRYLKHSQRKEVCGNVIEFHRYFAGINVKVLSLRNHNIGGLFNDSRCLSNGQD